MVTVELEGVQESELLLSRYCTKGRVLQRTYNGKEYEIERYQGEHAHEYCVYEVKDGIRDGTAELFDDGIVKMRWTMKNGTRDGTYVLFEKGVVVQKGRWDDVGKSEERVIENWQNRGIMVIRVNGEVLYEGECNASMERDGMGFEYENGKLKQYGQWTKDELTIVKQRFVSKEEMIEYGDGATMDILSHKPVYIGGYKRDEASGLMKRDGWGRVLNETTGVCEYECKWVKGRETKKRPLFDGWYKQNDTGTSSRPVVTEAQSNNPLPATEEKPVLDLNLDLVPSDQPFAAYSADLQELIIDNNSYNDMTITELNLSGFKNLKRIIIGDNCFKEVPVVSIMEMKELISVVIGRNCFASNSLRSVIKSARPNAYLQIEECNKLKLLKIDNDSFYDYHSLQLNNLPALRFIELGITCFRYAPLFSLNSRYAAAIIPGLPHLQTVILGCSAFEYCHSVVFQSDWCGRVMIQICQDCVLSRLNSPL